MARKKAAAKKDSTIKAAAKAPKRESIPQAPTEQFFILIDGRVLKNYKELADMLEEMGDHVYGHHVNWERNDFASWVHDVFGDSDLAEKLRRAQGKHHSQIIIYRHILDRL